MSLICWSGGCDSTLALLDLARKSTPFDPVKALSIRHPQINAREEQDRSREAIKKWIAKRGWPVIYQEIQLEHLIANDIADYKKKDEIPGEEDIVSFFCVSDNGIFQPALWVPQAALYLEDNEDLFMGYVKGDDVWHRREAVVGLFNHIQSVLEKKGKIQFPLEWTKKEEILKRLSDLKVLDLCWSCEFPKRLTPAAKPIPCGKCHPCVRRLETSKIIGIGYNTALDHEKTGASRKRVGVEPSPTARRKDVQVSVEGEHPGSIPAVSKGKRGKSAVQRGHAPKAPIQRLHRLAQA